eukprot:TRINITY_DN20112_c4_g1_i1.p1 TRINITY_DN20112_c4_g1~~TRINITY_DN20112_c4_g1_i1.p1  ORF type:complete len:489 (+),score=57.26 TRINITY_DN20112_c4_g1_i1:24-1469(+)
MLFLLPVALLLPSGIQAASGAVPVTPTWNSTFDRRYAVPREHCYADGLLFRECCCGTPRAGKCWSRGRHFLRCCAGRLQQCGGERRPQLHVAAFGLLSGATKTLAHSVLYWLETPLLLFGRSFDAEGDLPYELATARHDGEPSAGYLIRKLLLTRELLEEFPSEDIILYMDSTDALVQRGSRGDLLATFYGLLSSHRSRGNKEPVIFAGQQHCHPFELWSPRNLADAERGEDARAREWHSAYDLKVYGTSGMGPRLVGGRAVCEVVNDTVGASSGLGLGFADSGTWMGRIETAKVLFGLLAGVAVSERLGHCMEALKLIQAWYPGLAAIDAGAELFWTTELELPARDGYTVNERHAAVQRVKERVQRTLCSSEGGGIPGYWDAWERPAPLVATSSQPFVIHHAGPSKATLGKRCSTTYGLTFVRARDRWHLQDLDSRRAIRLRPSMLEGTVFAALQRRNRELERDEPGRAEREASRSMVVA